MAYKAVDVSTLHYYIGHIVSQRMAVSAWELIQLMTSRLNCRESSGRTKVCVQASDDRMIKRLRSLLITLA